MTQASQRDGWRISQVEQLIGLPRRDIQRACYNGRGGADILAPEDSTWGRRTYDQEDLARLFVVRQYKGCGYSLPEIKGIFEAANNDCLELLDVQIARLEERHEEVEGQLMCARALKIALDSAPGDATTESATPRDHAASGEGGAEASAARNAPNDEDAPSGREAIAALVEYRSNQLALELSAQTNGKRPSDPDDAESICEQLRRLATCMRDGLAPGSEEARSVVGEISEHIQQERPAKTEALSLGFLNSLLDEPGVDLAVELWLGSGSYAYIRDAIDGFATAAEQPEKPRRRRR